MERFGYVINKESENDICLTRLTRESKIDVAIESGGRKESKFDTGIQFFNHMLETVASRACMNMSVIYSNARFRLTHVITEDVGITLGRAFKMLLEKRIPTGINGSGSGIANIDEASAMVLISFEGRANTFINIESGAGAKKELVEDMLSDDLSTFFEGFSQGASCTITIMTFSGNNGHHTWEAIFRAFGEALRAAFSANPWRMGTIVGIKGTLE